MRFLVCVGVVGFAVCAACGGSDQNPLLGDGGNTDTGTGNDGNTGNDAQAQDSPTGADASDGSVVDASCPGFCAGLKGNLFCSDFDNEATPADWSATATSGGGTVVITQTQDVSCPNGLASSLPQITAQSGGTAKVAKNITINPITHVVLKLEVYLPSNDTTSYVAFFGVRPTAEPGTGVYLTHHGDPYWFLTSAVFGNVNIGITVAPLTGAWNAMTLDVKFGNTNNDVSLTYTGVDNATHTVTGSGNTANASPSSITLEVGMQSGATEAAFDAYYDNVVIAMAP